ncbi:MAG: nucleoside deaminase [Planctomycetales bacterium]|nr:nucleoside deaminase [Planctomycetales bacterium]
MSHRSLTIEMPEWVAAYAGCRLKSGDRSRMEVAIELSARNVAEATGGPFGAVIVEESTGVVAGAGVNLVVDQRTSLAHAEAIATLAAQRHAATFDLAAKQSCRYTLYASGQPCIMCLGILWWSGVTRLVFAARNEDIEQIAGFCEGPLPENWRQKFASRKGLPAIEVVPDLLRDQACDVLRDYAKAGHQVYNPGSSAT